MATLQQSGPAEKAESFVSFGAPVCDICRDLAPEERPDEGDYWPDPAVHYIRHDEQAAYEWWGVTVCDHHDDFEHVPEGATHRLVDEPEFVGDDPDRMNSAYRHHISEIIPLDA